MKNEAAHEFMRLCLLSGKAGTGVTLEAAEAPCRSLSYVFGTLAEIVLPGKPPPTAQEITAAVFEEFDRLHWKLHAWKSSKLVALNRAIARGETSIAVDPEIAGLIRDAGYISERSGGLFNPALGKLVELWNFHADECSAALPDRAAVASVVHAGPRMRDLVVEGNTIKCANTSVQIDLGGYAKGYALGRASGILRARGAGDALLNLGGHVMALGQCGDRAWSVGIRHPRRSGPLGRIELLDGESISTSGDYERYFTVKARRYAHLIDPRTGHPAKQAQAASVLTRAGAAAPALSDAASGALFVAGPQEWREVARRMGIDHALLVDGDGAIHLTKKMHARLELIEKDMKLLVR